MTKKNDKKLCWNCEGNVSHHLSQCPYCGVDVTKAPQKEQASVFKGFESPFSSALKQPEPSSFYTKESPKELAVSEEEWNSALNQQNESGKQEPASVGGRREMVALLLLLPGIAFFLFGLVLILFASDGVLTLQWNQDVAYFYFIGASPLLYIGWRALNKSS